MRILHALTRYGSTGEGNVKRLTDREGLYRLRVGKWRIFFDLDSPDSVRIHGMAFANPMQPSMISARDVLAVNCPTG